MCTTVYGRASDGEIYELYSCADLAGALECQLQKLVQRIGDDELEPDECLCNIDVEASAARHGKSVAADGTGDYELLEES